MENINKANENQKNYQDKFSDLMDEVEPFTWKIANVSEMIFQLSVDNSSVKDPKSCIIALSELLMNEIKRFQTEALGYKG